MKWSIKPKAPEDFIRCFPEYSPLICQLLYDRGLKTQEQIDEFFNPDYQGDLHDPFLIKGMKKAVERIIGAIKRQEKIVVYGDYDTDGVCATVILFLTLKSLRAKNLDVYIPDRNQERHGLNKNAIEKLTQSGAKLIITVDCASRDCQEVDLANSLGLEVIITDHHQVGEKLPKAKAIVNPWQKGDKYPFKELAGAGVAYKLACALLMKGTVPGGASGDSPLKKWLLDLVAIATVTDVMPIISENRTLVKYGLGVLAQTQWIGLEELMKVARLTPLVTQASLNGEPPTTNLDTYTLGYILGPRISAASRIDHADIAFQLLVTENRSEAKRLAEDLNEKNIKRQNLIDQIVREIESRLQEVLHQENNPKLIFEGDKNWSAGLIGLAAGKIAEKYHRPTLLYREKESISYISGRSIPQFNLIEALEQCSSLLDEFGGHKGAAGFSVKNKRREEVKNKLIQIAEEKLTDEDLIPLLEIDAQLSPEEINWQNYDQLQLFQPFGQANPRPKFLVRDLEVSDLRVVGNNGKHLKLELGIMNHELGIKRKIKAIGFGLSEWAEKLKIGEKVDLVFEMIIDEWNGMRDLQMKVIDLKISKS